MTSLSPADRDAFRVAVEAAAGRAEVHRAVGNVYRAVSDAIELRRPVCATSGRCCRFDAFGHRLFITTMEMAVFVKNLGGLSNFSAGTDPGGCPFQSDKLCTIHTIRPFGCRIFFCDETAAQWQQEQYARFHAELKRLHDELKIAYYYVEWREALRSLGQGWKIMHVV